MMRIMMKKKPYDYSGFSLKKLTDPRFSHVLLLGGWIFYFSMYFITENLIPFEKCHVIYCALDDRIPFCEYFAIFYVGWYVLCFAVLGHTFFYDVPRFKKVQTYVIITQIIAMICYIVYPSRQELRPEVFERSNIFTLFLGWIYAFDTPTGICPSLHVAYSIGFLSAGLKDPKMTKLGKFLLTFTVVMICISVCFVKQHSVLDVIAAIPVCIIAELLVYGKDRKSKKKEESL